MGPRAFKCLILDANIIIGYLAGDERIVQKLSEWRRSGLTLFLPSVAEAEVLSFSKWTPGQRQQTEECLVENFVSVAFDRILARRAGELRAQFGLRFPDAAIAASALEGGMPLASRNVRDFKKVPELTIIAI